MNDLISGRLKQNYMSMTYLGTYIGNADMLSVKFFAILAVPCSKLMHSYYTFDIASTEGQRKRNGRLQAKLD